MIKLIISLLAVVVFTFCANVTAQTQAPALVVIQPHTDFVCKFVKISGTRFDSSDRVVICENNRITCIGFVGHPSAVGNLSLIHI